MLIYSTYPVDVQCIFLLVGRKSCKTAMLKMLWLQNFTVNHFHSPNVLSVASQRSKEFCRIFTLLGFLGEHRYQHTSSLGSAFHLRYRLTFPCQRRAPQPTVREMSMSPLCSSISVTVSLSLSSFVCFQGADINSLFFPTKC